MSLEENLTKCPKCSIDFTGRGWNKGNIKKHMDELFSSYIYNKMTFISSLVQ